MSSKRGENYAITGVNDIFNELSHENNGLLLVPINVLLFTNKCLDVLNKYKTQLNSICTEFELLFDPKLKQEINDLNNEYKKVMEEKENINKTIKNCIQTTEDLNNESFDNKVIETQSVEDFRQLIAKNLNSNVLQKNEKSFAEKCLYKKPYKCDFIGCNFATTKRSHLTEHMNRHPISKPFKCPKCEKTFIVSYLLKRHLKDVHVLEKTIACEYNGCKLMFKTESKMRAHLRLHLNDKPFSCDYPNCQYSVRYKSQLELHLVKHSEAKLKCTFSGCEKMFKTEETLREHLNVHNTEPIYKCSFEGCERKFKSKSTFNKHHRTHKTDQTIHSCDWPECGFKTNLKDQLKSHKCIHTGEKNYVCQWPECGKRFRLSQSLRDHQRIHNNDKRYVCLWPGCDYKCTNGGNFQKHKKIHAKRCGI